MNMQENARQSEDFLQEKNTRKIFYKVFLAVAEGLRFIDIKEFGKDLCKKKTG